MRDLLKANLCVNYRKLLEFDAKYHHLKLKAFNTIGFSSDHPPLL